MVEKRYFKDHKGEQVKYDERIYKFYMPLIKEYTLECMSKYIPNYEILSKLENIKYIEIVEDEYLSLQSAYNGNVLRLTQEFNSINNELIIEQEIELKMQLTQLGVYVVSLNKRDNSKDLKLKSFLTNYFVTKEYEDCDLNIYSPQEVVMQQLAKVFGEEFMYTAYQKGYNYFVTIINKLTNGNAIGEKIFDDLLEIDKLQEQKEKVRLIISLEHKLDKLEKELDNMDIQKKNSFLRYLELNNYNIGNFNNIVAKEEMPIFTNYEIDIMNAFNKLFEKIYGASIKDKTSFVEVFRSFTEIFYSNYKEILEIFSKNWDILQKRIIKELLPKYKKYTGNNSVNYIDLMSLGELVSKEDKFDNIARIRNKD